ncbi:DoxX family protein [Flaviaesturariibacter aridisoli]|uniref:DoxX family protein n=1 Tax=Flaviaesturariibacter aridisoli TaxID=2545761 RepID=A0A4R4DWL5_9BACT|nr:DoxX family protein [Flaviaesturariibacter aridisoli]TCZ65196.1 DoxX family protein [Flaviaesturariibacter aridisoli]
MNSIQHLQRWGEAHHPRYMDLVRIALGVFLCIKGIEFATHSNYLYEVISSQVPFSGFLLMLLQHYIIFAHIVGGFMIATGMLTRAAALAQIPILLGALIFVNSGMTAHFTDFLLTLVLLAGLVWFFIIGSGYWSLDRLFDREEVHGKPLSDHWRDTGNR